MNPLTKIEIGNSQWLGVLAVACTVASELLHLANNPEGQRVSFVDRELLRRALQTRANAR